MVLDVLLPDRDGLDALGRIMEVNPKLPVILHTAHTAYRERFMSWAADAYVVKSGDLTELKTRLREALAKR